MTTDNNHASGTMGHGFTLEPTDLQHRMAKVLATAMRAALPTGHDKQIVLVLLASASGVDEDWDAFRHMVEILSPQHRAGHGWRAGPWRQCRVASACGQHACADEVPAMSDDKCQAPDFGGLIRESTRHCGSQKFLGHMG